LGFCCFMTGGNLQGIKKGFFRNLVILKLPPPPPERDMPFTKQGEFKMDHSKEFEMSCLEEKELNSH